MNGSRINVSDAHIQRAAVPINDRLALNDGLRTKQTNKKPAALGAYDIETCTYAYLRRVNYPADGECGVGAVSTCKLDDTAGMLCLSNATTSLRSRREWLSFRSRQPLIIQWIKEALDFYSSKLYQLKNHKKINFRDLHIFE